MTNLGFIIVMGVLIVLALISYIRYKKEVHNSSSRNKRLDYDNDEYDYGHNVNHNETNII